MKMKDQILQAARSPSDLEALYRAGPAAFKAGFPEAFAAGKDSLILQVWQERLKEEASPEAGGDASGWHGRDIGLIIGLTLLIGTLVRLPTWLPALEEERFLMGTFIGLVGSGMLAFLCWRRFCPPRRTGVLFLLLLGGILWLNGMPAGSESDTFVLATLHMPVVCWSIIGVAYAGGSWRGFRQGMAYLRDNGEMLIYGAVIALGGGVLTALTLALFELIGLRIEEWYMRHVAVYGAVASPLVAFLLIDQVVGRRFRLAPVMARVFTPLFLLTLIAFAAAMLVQQRSPFTDRDFLLAFNGLLLVVLGLCVLSVSERGSHPRAGLADYLTVGLTGLTLLLNAVALSAILFRLGSYGFSPNRLAVLGANLLAFGHLSGLLWHLLRFIRQKTGEASLDRWVAGYLPAYTVWCLVVAVGFPLLFGFQ